MYEVTAFVLAGGRSSRMGRDKALLEICGATLLSRAISTASQASDQVRIVGSAAKYGEFGQVVEDAFPGRGPLGGIHAALLSTETDLNLMLAVDTPFMHSDFLRYLVDHARTGDALVVVPRIGGRLQPLCAVYRRAFATMAQRALESGQNKIGLLFAPAITRVIEQEEIESLAFEPRMFDNVNTPEELQRAVQAAEERP